MNKFKIGDKVTSVINPHFLGQIVAISLRKTGVYYTISYFKDEEPMTATMDEFEIEPITKDNSLGFQNSRKERINGKV